MYIIDFKGEEDEKRERVLYGINDCCKYLFAFLDSVFEQVFEQCQSKHVHSKQKTE